MKHKFLFQSFQMAFLKGIVPCNKILLNYKYLLIQEGISKNIFFEIHIYNLFQYMNSHILLYHLLITLQILDILVLVSIYNHHYYQNNNNNHNQDNNSLKLYCLCQESNSYFLYYTLSNYDFL